ncbi:cell division protein FtsQ/DivIB [Francisella frigiditurris]|uniref:Cell division FtsQ family protein n=1 Tax=Francisella frigiditurris TaxID=1542390 RepID=A0A1J0KSZ6_9GAMM|nr:cell division protein FtsQ/DivIB [Francisella frigiditurris]APC96819.1 cell division FtsQ family protein [Francisella frigiditurris]
MIKIVKRFVLFLICVAILLIILFFATRIDENISKVDVVSNDQLFYISKQDLIDKILESSNKGWLDFNAESLEYYISDFQGTDYTLVKKIWPSTLVVYIYEREPIAYWGEKKVLLDDMTIISPTVFNYDKYLPRINGPDKNKDYIYGEYLDLERIAQKNNVEIIDMDYEGNLFSVKLSDGFYVKLGSKDLIKRFEKFFKFYEQVKNYESVKYFDMRYDNGFVVKY